MHSEDSAGLTSLGRELLKQSIKQLQKSPYLLLLAVVTLG